MALADWEKCEITFVVAVFSVQVFLPRRRLCIIIWHRNKKENTREHANVKEGMRPYLSPKDGNNPRLEHMYAAESNLCSLQAWLLEIIAL